MNDAIFPFDNTYARLPERFFAEVTPQRCSAPRLIAWNRPLAAELGLPLETFSPEELARLFSGNRLPSGAKPIATAYAGHQFGHFNPQLGDGRALLLGEVVSKEGKRYDIQLKGSGVTPFSRRGDGLSALGPVLREYILSEAMFHLGVPTTRALAAVVSGDTVYREEAVPGGVFTRVAASHLRVGSFEYFAARNDIEGLRTLLSYAIERHYPEIASDEKPALAFLKKVIEAQASLVAHWMDLGFIHGVMNTDNFSVAGITIDYGPCAFMDHFKSDQVFSSIDRHGRYAYRNQPGIALWNLVRLAEALLPLFDDRAAFEKELNAFQGLYETSWLKRMSAKLGLEKVQDRGLIESWLNYLEKEELDYTLSFRNLARLLTGASEVDFPKTAEFTEFETRWRASLGDQGFEKDEVVKRMNSRNPAYIPRNHQVERAIKQGLAGDFSVFHEINEVLARPFEERPSFEAYALPPKPEERVLATFCGT